ncbi:MAG: P63C domain-containing protein [Proteobacteria bacterium]|nr:P63C domain-containing protein [Pseudomonadota bacterium]MBU4384280.1 P63C domain-containing protein [Pseudomonadota bacterium]MCG2764099.1 P63C domain-containing protein [Desulfarculaceae bacterium]
MKDNLPRAICGSEDRPLKLGGVEIPCYVLEDGRRVLVQRGMIKALGMARGSSGGSGGDRLAKFVGGKTIKQYVPDELAEVTSSPFKIRTERGTEANAYEAQTLADICEAVLKARDDKALQKQQQHIAKQCEILMRGFARVGIVALVDEATGYQYIRARKALEEILDKFISEELRKWAKTFPDEFYERMFQLRGWQYTPFSVKRPGVVGRYTNDLIYERLAPGVLAELRKKNPTYKPGQRKHKMFQWLTEDVGNPRLREHITAVIALMRAASNWRQFYSMINRALPRYGANMELPLSDEDE